MTAGVARDPATDQGRTPSAPRTRGQRLLRIASVVLLAMLVVGSPWWGPRALAQLDFFHVRRVEFEGLRYARAVDLVRALAVDTTQSVWQSLPALESRITAHPLVAAAAVERRMPGTILVHIAERQPVALVMARGELRPVDASGAILPIDLVLRPMDVPIVTSRDSAMLRLLDGLRQEAPLLYARISEAQRAGPDELRLLLGSPRGPVTVRTSPDVTVSRFRDILPVEADLARNNLRVAELDLRFRDQVIARQP
ncbi:MAG TPA: FtsQ-type POTRA domain-containing protein [Gemmatimonas sp.]|nr:FtsQ-type POTRA domain-containing protein [Gemmatimonas sp.]